MNTEKKIASYEDACRVLNIQPINEEVFNIFPKEDQRSMLAYHKLTVITRALNNGWKPDWDDQNEWKYYPLFRYVNAGLSCLIVVGCDTDTKDKNGEDSTGVMVGFCGNYGAIIKGLKELLTGKQSAPIVERATREIAFEKMIKGGGIESFLKNIMNNN